ncbi:MAG: glycosyltransferase family 2 protein [Clostridia bacterium]|nr:glycosyltransferase family 2 protein [Clostridia bacterium]
MEILLYSLFAVFCGVSLIGIVLFFPRMKCWFYAFGHQEKLYNPKKNRLAVIVPAKNESESITPFFDSVDRQTYEKELFDVYVVVDDPSDPTIAMTEQRGHNPVIVSGQTKKGDALDGCLKRILMEDSDAYDAYIVIDADTVLDDAYLEEMNNAMIKDTEIVVSKKRVKNYYFGDKSTRTLSACCNGIIWTLMDNMGNYYKSKHGYPCFIVGTGFLMRADLVRKNGGWPYQSTLTEDVELLMDTVLSGYKTTYYEHAIIYMEEATKLSVTNNRRQRWMTGVVDSERLYTPRIDAKVRNKRDWKMRFYVTNLNIVYSLVGTALAYSAINLVLTLVLAILAHPLWWWALLGAVIGIGAIYAYFLVPTLIAVFSDWKVIKLSFPGKILLIFAHPIYYMGYIPVMWRALFSQKGRSTWVAIERGNFTKGR